MYASNVLYARSGARMNVGILRDYKGVKAKHHCDHYLLG